MSTLALDRRRSAPVALTYWNRVEPRPRSAEIADALAAQVRDPLWMLTRQWQFGEFHGEDAGSPAWVQIATSTAPVLGWRPRDTGAPWAAIDRPLEDLVETEGFTANLTVRVEVGRWFGDALAAQGLAHATIDAILGKLRAAFPLRADTISPVDRSAQRFFALCDGRVVDGIALAEARKVGTALPADSVIVTNQAAIEAALDVIVEDVAATFGDVSARDAVAWDASRLETRIDVATAMPGSGVALLRADPNRDGDFEWYAFDIEVQAQRGLPPAPAVAAQTRTSFLPAHVRFKGMPNQRWWDFERSTTDFGAVIPDRRDLAKLMVMDFMLIQGNDWFMVPLDVPVGSVCRIDELVVHDVFGGTTLIERADKARVDPSLRWTCFSLASTDPAAPPADIFLVPPSAAAVRLVGDAIEDVRLVRDEQANYVWAIEHSTEGGDGRMWLGYERSIAESAGEPTPAVPAIDSPLRYQLQSFVPRHWYPLLPVSIDATTGETAFELGRMLRPDGSVPEPTGRILRPPGTPPYRIREEEVPRVGLRVLRETVRSRWLLGETSLWIARRTVAGRGEGSSGLRYDRAIVQSPKVE